MKTNEQTQIAREDLRLCVAIPTYNREQVLIDTIEQVLALVPSADETLVIDQTLAHEQATEEYLARADRAGKIRWIKHQPPNLPGARNRALQETTCDVVIFIDDDVELPSDFVSRHRENYREASVVAVAGRTIQPPNHRYPKAPASWPQVMDHVYFPLNSTERAEGIASFQGCNHSVRTKYMREIGGYDENFVGWAFREDSDAAIRIWKLGGLIVFDPKAELVHLAIPGGGCRIKTKRKRIPEWRVSFPSSYFACRHLYPSLEFWRQIFLVNFRRYALRKDIVFYPWRFPGAATAYWFAFIYAIVLCGRPIKSPFANELDQTR